MIRRRSPLKRSPLKRSRTRIPARRAKPRRGPERSKPYRDWIRENGECVACRVEWERQGRPSWRWKHPVDPAHTENNGMGSKGPDSSCAPLCRGFDTPNHHREYDGGRAAFESKYGLDMQAEAARSWAAFQAS